MRRGFAIVSTAVISSAVTSVFWILAYSTVGGASPPASTRATAREAGAGQVEIASALEVGPAGMVIPVANVTPAQLADTFTQARAGGTRVHDAIDIMAPSGTPVLAAASGRVEKLFFSAGGGGVTAYVRSPDRRWNYYYAHLQEYAPGLREGMTVRRGQMLGRVGYTGNANPAGPHLHFAINRMDADQRFHEGSPVNPYPLLVGR